MKERNVNANVTPKAANAVTQMNTLRSKVAIRLIIMRLDIGGLPPKLRIMHSILHLNTDRILSVKYRFFVTLFILYVKDFEYFKK